MLPRLEARHKNWEGGRQDWGPGEDLARGGDPGKTDSYRGSSPSDGHPRAVGEGCRGGRAPKALPRLHAPRAPQDPPRRFRPPALAHTPGRAQPDPSAGAGDAGSRRAAPPARGPRVEMRRSQGQGTGPTWASAPRVDKGCSPEGTSSLRSLACQAPHRHEPGESPGVTAKRCRHHAAQSRRAVPGTSPCSLHLSLVCFPCNRKINVLQFLGEPQIQLFLITAALL